MEPGRHRNLFQEAQHLLQRLRDKRSGNDGEQRDVAGGEQSQMTPANDQNQRNEVSPLNNEPSRAERAQQEQALQVQRCAAMETDGLVLGDVLHVIGFGKELVDVLVQMVSVRIDKSGHRTGARG